MITLAIILTTLSVGVEMFAVLTFDVARRFMIKHERLGLFFSFMLSFSIGEMFGAHGLIALIGGLGSTLVTTVIYKTHALTVVDYLREDETKVKIAAFKTQCRTVTSNLWGVAKYMYWIITFPWRVYVWTKMMIGRIASGASELMDRCRSFIGRAKRHA